MTIRVHFIGMQSRLGGKPPVALVNLAEDVADLGKKGATFALETLEKRGYNVWIKGRAE